MGQAGRGRAAGTGGAAKGRQVSRGLQPHSLWRIPTAAVRQIRAEPQAKAEPRTARRMLTSWSWIEPSYIRSAFAICRDQRVPHKRAGLCVKRLVCISQLCHSVVQQAGARQSRRVRPDAKAFVRRSRPQRRAAAAATPHSTRTKEHSVHAKGHSTFSISSVRMTEALPSRPRL